MESAYPDGFDSEAFDLDEINELLADGLEGVRGQVEDVHVEDDMDEDDSDDPAKPDNMIPFPPRRH